MMANFTLQSSAQTIELSSLTTTKLLADPTPTENIEDDIRLLEPKDRPDKMNVFDFVTLLAVTATMLCLVLAILVVIPNYWLSWKLGFTGQIVFVGFLMSTMNLCMQTVVPSLFLKLEANWGQSILQNYDAILRNRFLAPQVGAVWRTILIVLVVLPLGLSVAYKRFFGGTSTRPIKTSDLNFSNHTYGAAFPSLGDFATIDSTLFLMIHPVAELLVASSNDSNYNSSLQFPAAYGYNVLLLSNTSAAMLDIPTPDFVSEVQSQLRAGESWYIKATVQAYVAQFNQSCTQLARGPTSYWNDTIKYNAANAVEHRNRLNAKWWYYEDLSFGTFPLYPTDNTSSTVYMGAFRPDTSLGDLIDTFDPIYQRSDYSSFVRNAQGFSIRRDNCSARWKIDVTGIKLLHGSCQNISISSKALSDPDSMPFAIDTLPVLTNTAASFAILRSDSPWATPFMAASAACMYWSLAVRRFVGTATRASEYGLLYKPIDESTESSVSAMKTTWLLYLVLAIQPLITIAAFCGTVLLRSSPVNNGFGLISILSGVYRPSLDILQKTGSSGNLQRPIILKILGAGLNIHGQAPDASQRVRFLLHEKDHLKQRNTTF